MDPLVVKTVIALVPVIVCLGVFVSVDVFKLVPLPEVFGLLLAGAVACVASYYAAGQVIDQFPVQRTIYSQDVAPVLEESMKGVLIVLLFAFNRIGYLIDAAIAGFAVGAGFSVAENIFYLHQFTDANMGVWLVRGLGTAIMHGGATAILAVCSQVLYAPRLRASADAFRFNVLLFLPGLAGAAALHFVFNQFTAAPLVAMAVVLVAVPVAVFGMFSIGETYAHRWLAAGHGAHAKLLADIDSGAFALSTEGRAVQALADRLGEAAAADIFDYVRTHTELVVHAETRLLALEEHEQVERETQMREKFHHLHELERRLGRTIVLAARQHLRFSRNDLWEMHELEEHVPVLGR
jgi:RsiW-degrading membrane proteinase PrsW (M82 family)